ncbi:hypothetical protein AB0F30_30600 [Streptomyces sp. NPDC029006]|uniref:hypothetical protein n=1 Tax=Streptomyces sp. NPDC029006 TaxID=3155467 RepID=UPI0033FBB26E
MTDWSSLFPHAQQLDAMVGSWALGVSVDPRVSCDRVAFRVAGMRGHGGAFNRVTELSGSAEVKETCMGLVFRRNDDGTTTGRNEETGFTVTLADAEEVKRLLHEDAGWEYTPPPHPVPHGFHRFLLMREEFGEPGPEDERYAELRARPPAGCVPADWDCLVLECERPGTTLLNAVTMTVAEIKREYGLVMNSLGIEKPQEWLGNDTNGHGARIVAHLLLAAAQRAALLGYGRKDLVRLLDATGIR